MSGRLVVLGLGLEPARHATLETLQLAGDCARVFADGAAARFLRPFLRAPARRFDERAILSAVRGGALVGVACVGPVGADARLVRLLARARFEWSLTGQVSPTGAAISAAGATLGTRVRGVQAVFASRIPAARLDRGLATVVFVEPELPAKEWAAARRRLRADFSATATPERAPLGAALYFDPKK